MKYAETFCDLGQSFSPSPSLTLSLGEYTCCLYKMPNCKFLNDARLAWFKAGKYSDDYLPSSRDSLLRHIHRANYQASIWIRAVIGKPFDVYSLSGNGWIVEKDDLKVQRMTLQQLLILFFTSLTANANQAWSVTIFVVTVF